MSLRVIKTYSRRQPVAVFKSESRLVPSLPDRVSRIRESRLNDKTLVIDTFDDTFDRLASDVVIPSPKSSPKQDAKQDDPFDALFKVPQQTQKAYNGRYNKQVGRARGGETSKDKKVNSEKRKPKASKTAVPSKAHAAKRKKINSTSSDEDVDEAPWVSGVDGNVGKEGNKKKASKKRKLSHAKNKNDNRVELKGCVIPLERFNLSVSAEENDLKVADKNKENLQQSNDNLLSAVELQKQTGYLTSTPRHQKKRLRVSMYNISPIVLNTESVKNSSDHFFSNNTNAENNAVAEIDDNKSNISKSLFSSHSMSKIDREKSRNDHYSKPSPVSALHTDGKSLNVNQANRSSFEESPLLFDDTQESQKSKRNLVVSLEKAKNLSKSIHISFSNSSASKKPCVNQNDSKKNIHQNISKFYESSFILDDWTNDYNSSYEYFADKDDDNEKTKNSFTKDKLNNHAESHEKDFNNLINKSSTASRPSVNTRSSKSKSNKNKTINKSTEENVDQSIGNASLNETKVNDSKLKNEKRVLSDHTADEENNKTDSFHNDKSITTLGQTLSRKKSVDEKLNQQLYVVVPKLNHKDITDELRFVPNLDSDEQTEKITNRKSRRISNISNKDYQSVNKDSSLLNEESPKLVRKSNLVRNSDSNLEKSNNHLADSTETELRNNLLKIPPKVTLRRNLKKKLDKSLEAIAEDFVESSSSITEEMEKVNEIVKSKAKISNVNKNSGEDVSLDNENEHSLNSRENQPIFLKPGKSWARSLSIINHFHNGQDLEELAVGRGKHWRQSVQTVLDMQPDGGNVEGGDRESNGKLSCPTAMPNRVSLISTSPTRHSRFSIRIIPSGKRSTLTNDFFNTERSSSIGYNMRKTSVLRKTSLKIRRDTLIETEEDLIKSARDIILKRCNQTSYVLFSDSFPDTYIDYCRKIGEGVYGEVFLYHKNDEKSVIKIIPIEGDQLVNCEPQKKFHEILSEIIISEELHKLKFGDLHNTSGFVGVNRIMCVQGKYPDKLIDLWKIYDEEKKSENDCPSMFDDDQLYIILELAHGGQDLEAYVFQNASEAYSIFLQTAYSLAVAEKSLEFEHRDLHWGNILVSKTAETKSSFKLNNNEISLPTKGVKVSVIDFTLSRLSYKGCKIFNDLALDPTLFAAQGEYQFDIYRMMRDSVSNDWQQFNPYTNILWLDYTLDKMIDGVRYKKKTTKVHKTAISQMIKLRKTILKYESAFDFVSDCEKITV